MPKMKRKLVWIVPEERGGIRDYADELWPHIEALCGQFGWSAVRINSGPLRTREAVRNIISKVKELDPSLIHVQHEFGLFGSKVPFRYRFPEFATLLAEIAPCVATAHNVLYPEYELPWQGKGVQGGGRWLFNKLLLPIFKRQWLVGTWGPLSGVIVHSRLQERAIFSSGCSRVVTIPHFVPVRPIISVIGTSVVVFGFFSPEKAQDVIINAWKHLRTQGMRLVLAGGVRRSEDQPFFDQCAALISSLGLRNEVEITGYVPSEKVDEIFAGAALVVAPFRETTGSGSLAQAFARGMPVVASDLPLNAELLEREPGCLELFAAENAIDCAEKIDMLLADHSRKEELAKASLRYAKRFSPLAIALSHFGFYDEILPPDIRTTC